MRRLRGYELRCVLTLHLFQHGPATIAELIETLDFHGFELAGRASHVVSDACAARSRTKESSIAARTLRTRSLNAESDKAFWDALLGPAA